MREIYKARQFCHFHKRVVYHPGISIALYMKLLRYICICISPQWNVSHLKQFLGTTKLSPWDKINRLHVQIYLITFASTFRSNYPHVAEALNPQITRNTLFKLKSLFYVSTWPRNCKLGTANPPIDQHFGLPQVFSELNCTSKIREAQTQVKSLVASPPSNLWTRKVIYGPKLE